MCKTPVWASARNCDQRTLPPTAQCRLTRDAGKAALPFPSLEGRVKKLGLSFHRKDIGTERSVRPSGFVTYDLRWMTVQRRSADGSLAPRSVERLLADRRLAAVGVMSREADVAIPTHRIFPMGVDASISIG